MADSLKDKAIKGTLWSSLERFSVQGMQFVVMLLIARILGPKNYGLIGMLMIFIALSRSLTDSGFGQALIRKENNTDADRNTVFYFNLVVSCSLYLLLFAIAPLVADFYNEPQLVSVMRVYCLVVIIDSLAIIQRSILTYHIDFKTQMKASVAATIVSSAVALIMAYKGFGVWALVGQQLSSAVINTLTLWLYSKWRPSLLYSWKSFHELFSFGSKLMISGVINTVYSNLYALVVGKVFNATTLGFYTRAQHYSEFPSSNVTSVLQRVTYPVLCKMKDDTERLRINYRRMLRLSAFVVFPLMCGMAGAAYPLVEVLLGHKWHYAATLLIPISFAMMWYPVHSLNLNLLQVKGRSDLFLKLEIIKKLIGVTILAISVPFGLLFMCYTKIFSALISLFINTYYTGKLIQVGFFRQLGDLLKTLVTSLCMFAIVFGINHYIDSYLVQLIADIIVGAVFYIGVAFVFKFEEVDYLKSILKKDETTR